VTTLDEFSPFGAIFKLSRFLLTQVAQKIAKKMFDIKFDIVWIELHFWATFGSPLGDFFL
jgi:hypothetical protein